MTDGAMMRDESPDQLETAILDLHSYAEDEGTQRLVDSPPFLLAPFYEEPSDDERYILKALIVTKTLILCLILVSTNFCAQVQS